ncbi:MAG: VanW family protein [Bacillota bacterium]
MNKLKRLTALFVVIILQTTLAIYAGGYFFKGPSDGMILQGIKAAGIDIGGLTPASAEVVLKERLAPPEKESLYLVAEERQWAISLEKVKGVYSYREAVEAAFAIGNSGAPARRISEFLGNKAVSTDVSLPLAYDRESLKKELERINNEYTVQPRDAKLVEEDGNIKSLPASEGYEIDLDATMAKIIDLKAGSDFRVSIVSRTLSPRVIEDDIAGLTDVFGECTTRFEAGSAGRSMNIARASEKLGGKLVMPGEILSFNSFISPVNEGNGYYRAPVIIGGQLVDDYGGGVCQVATTLYGAALLSGLEIIERRNHSKPVKYVAPGLDATVADGSIDLKIRNNLKRPVYIMSTAVKEKGYVKVLITGKKEGKNFYRIKSDVKTISPGIVIKSNPGLKRGQSRVVTEGAPGYEASVYRLYFNGDIEEARELISKDYYQPDPKVVEVGFVTGKR